MKYHNIVKLFIGNGARWDPISTYARTISLNSVQYVNISFHKLLITIVTAYWKHIASIKKLVVNSSGHLQRVVVKVNELFKVL